MKVSRRAFLTGMALAGGSVLLRAHGSPERPVAPGTDSTTQPTPREPGTWEPAYVELERRGEFAARVDEAYSHLERCDLCPRECGVNRLRGETGICRAPKQVAVYSYQPHFGEELPLVGRAGSGTIFFSNCNLRCVFCQNWPIAHEGRGRERTDDQLADMMLALERNGCPNINVVTPTHVMPHILNATRIAMQKGLRTPLCYNTGGYERPQIVRLLDGIVDIYLPDLKFMDSSQSKTYLGTAADYPEMAQSSILEMHRQVGLVEADPNGVARRGLMIRHLVMPNNVADTDKVIDWIARNLPAETYLNIMAQYRVDHRAFEYPKIARAITPEEFIEAIDHAKAAGLTNLDSRSLSNYEVFRRRS